MLCFAAALSADAAAAAAVEVPTVSLTCKRQRKTGCKVTEFVEGAVADAVMAEYRQQEAYMGAQVSLCSPSARCVA
jgi:hypothetical protein